MHTEQRRELHVVLSSRRSPLHFVSASDSRWRRCHVGKYKRKVRTVNRAIIRVTAHFHKLGPFQNRYNII